MATCLHMYIHVCMPGPNGIMVLVSLSDHIQKNRGLGIRLQRHCVSMTTPQICKVATIVHTKTVSGYLKCTDLLYTMDTCILTTLATHQKMVGWFLLQESHCIRMMQYRACMHKTTNLKSQWAHYCKLTTITNNLDQQSCTLYFC